MKPKPIIFLAVFVIVVVVVAGVPRFRGSPAPSVAGSRDTSLRATIALPAILEKLKSSGKQQAGLAIATLARLGVGDVRVYLRDEGDGTGSPVAIVDDPQEAIWKELSTNPIVNGFLTRTDDTTYEIKWDRLSDRQVPARIREVVIRQADKRVLVGLAHAIDLVVSGAWDPERSMLAELARRTQAKSSLVSLGMLVPNKVPGELSSKLAKDDPLKASREARMLLKMAEGFLGQVAGQLEQVDAVSMSFSMPDAQLRRLQCSVALRSPGAASVLADLVDKPLSAPSSDSRFLSGLAALLAHPKLERHVALAGSLVDLDLGWKEPADRELGRLLGKSVMALMFSGASFEPKPSEGPIVCEYAKKPVLSETVDVEQVAARVGKHLERCFFPTMYFEGKTPTVGLEMDPIDIPNASLCGVSYRVRSVKTTSGKDALRKTEHSFTSPLSLDGSFGSHLQIPIVPGTPGESLVSAKIAFEVEIPGSIAIFSFKAGEEPRSRAKAGVTVTVKTLSNDVASVSVRGAEGKPRLYAFDVGGDALARSESMAGGGSAAARFKGPISELWVVVAMAMSKHSFTVDVDLNGGKRIELPKAPSSEVPVRFVTTAPKRYASLTERELDGLQVKWNESKDRAWDKGLVIDLPKAVAGGRAKWELHWFAHAEPIRLDGGSFWQPTRFSWSPRDGFGDAAAVFGRVELTIPSGFRTVQVEKKHDLQWNEQKVGNKTIKLRFDRNTITHSAKGLKVIALRAFDAAGGELRAGSRMSSSKDGQMRYYWGQPARAELTVSLGSLTRRMPVEIVQRLVDDAKFRAYRTRVEKQRKIALALRGIGNAMKKAWNRYGDDLAGLRYVYGRDGKPANLVPEAVAHACPNGASRFGYEHKAFGGYTFSLVKFREQNGEKKPLFRQGKTRKFRWVGGEFEGARFNTWPGLVATPLDPKQPTFVYAWSNVYSKRLDGKPLEALPGDLWQAWERVEIVE